MYKIGDTDDYLNLIINKNKYCIICLSSDRILTPIGYLATVYRKFSSLQQHNSFSEMEVCWECKAILKRFDELKNKVERSEYIFINYLQMCDRITKIFSTQCYIRYAMIFHFSLIFGSEKNWKGFQNNIPKSLSTLSTIVITEDTHKFFTEQAETQEIKTEIFDDIDFGEHNYKEDNDTLIDKVADRTKILENNIKSVKLRIKKQVNNTWAKRRAKYNKKIKFKKLIQNSDIVYLYKKALIHPNELNMILEKERNNNIFVAKIFKCNKCILGFDIKQSYKKHNLVFHNKLHQQYICDTCETQLPTKRKLILHCQKHLYKYTCNICQYSCTNKCHIYEHIKVCHKHMYQCVECKLQFGTDIEFKNHFKEIHENFICDYCGVKFKMKYSIRNHIRKQHCPLRCSFCPRTFFRYNTLWLHKKLKHPPQELERAYCVECNKHYHNIYSYKWHLNNSVRHRPRNKQSVPCPGCDKVFTKNIYMKDHYDLVHLSHYKYRCEQCNKNFVRNADLVKHTRRVHEGVQYPKNKICYVCGRGFSSNKILTNHIRTHTGEKPFQCEFCSAKFAQKVALIVHIKNVHHKKKPEHVHALNDT